MQPEWIAYLRIGKWEIRKIGHIELSIYSERAPHDTCFKLKKIPFGLFWALKFNEM